MLAAVLLAAGGSCKEILYYYLYLGSQFAFDEDIADVLTNVLLGGQKAVRPLVMYLFSRTDQAFLWLAILDFFYSLL